MKCACRRNAFWLAFGLIALTAVASYAEESVRPTDQVAETDESSTATGTVRAPTVSDEDQAVEASRAYKQAMFTLSTITAHPPTYTHDSSFVSGYNLNSKSIFSTLLSNLQGRGPIGSAIRILAKIHQQLFRGVSTLSPSSLGLGSKRRDEDMSRKAIKVVDLLQHSADLGNTDALYSLAQISLFPPTTHFPSDPQLAYDSYLDHATLTGNATSQSILAFFYATGYAEVVPVGQARAQLHYTFAANSGDKGAQMALGYRYWSGIGTLEDCSRAMDWYDQAAEQSMAKFLSGPTGGRTLPQTHTRLSDLDGGIYGPGASVASTGPNANKPAIKAGLSREAGETWADILDFYMFNANRGETGFAFRLGKIYHQGSIYNSHGGIASGSEGVGAVPRDYGLALHYFLQIARQVWPRDPLNPLQYESSTPSKDENLPLFYAARSAGYLGRMYLRGEGVKADPAMAKMWFERGAEYGDHESNNGLGMLYRDGLIPGVKADIKKAMHYFAAAANLELAEAQVNIAKIHYERGDIIRATAFFEAAVRMGSPFEAYYYLGKIHSQHASVKSIPANVAQGSCAMAVSFYKLVSERGVWDDNLLREAEIAWLTGTDRGKEIAILKWWIAAERGWEIAQNNLAYIFDQDKTLLRLTRFSPMTPSNDTARLALTQWTRAAFQRNIDALVKVGDYYYHGLGVADEPESVRYEKAASYYQSAADTQMSALAMWNLGWMYENGVGVPQDFHLAKRHYDLALEANSEAYLPVTLSLIKLYLRSIWHTIQGGKNGLSLWEEEAEGDRSAAKEVPKIDESPPEEPVREPEQPPNYDDDEGPWYMGKARDEFHRRRTGQQGRRMEGEDDPIQWAREQKQAEDGTDDYLDPPLRGRREQEDNEEFSETMLLVLLCLTVSLLIYVRTRIVDRMRRDQQQRQRPGEGQPPPQAPPEPVNGVVLPPPEDPARNEWGVMQ